MFGGNSLGLGQGTQAKGNLIVLNVVALCFDLQTCMTYSNDKNITVASKNTTLQQVQRVWDVCLSLCLSVSVCVFCVICECEN